MKLIVNGQEHNLPDGTTVRDLIRHLGLADAVCAAEVNRKVVPRKLHDSTPLHTGDTVEIVALVGGG